MSTIPCKEITTIYPLNASVFNVRKASGINKKDGVIFLNITGGLPPYKIFIDDSLIVKDPIRNLQPKEYNIKVVDTANEVVNLIVEVGYETSPTYCSMFVIGRNISGAANCDEICLDSPVNSVIYARGDSFKLGDRLYKIPNGYTSCIAGTINWSTDVSWDRIKYNNNCYEVDNNGLITSVSPCGDVKVGSQYWASENLKVTKFRDGSDIQYIANFDDFIKYKGKPAYTSYEFGESWQTRGYLYNYAAITSAKILAPTGYRIPTKGDYDTLFGEVTSGGVLKSRSTWDSPNIGAENKFNYNAVASGYFQNNFKNINQKGNYWTSTNHPIGDGRKYIVSFSYDSENVYYGLNFISGSDEFYPVRLIKE
jgi:uncharacterized protein (TIGR02145 family)